MKTNSRFIKAVASTGLVVCSGAAVLGITSFASAKTSQAPTQVVAASDGADATGTVEARPNPVAEAAKALDMSEADLVAAFEAGKSIADVAKDRNVDIQKVIDALTAGFKAHLDAEVASGEHTQAEADAKLAEFSTRVTEMVNRAGGPRMGRGGHGGRGEHGGMRGGFVTDNLASLLKLSKDEIHTQLRAGTTLAAIAKAQGVSESALKKVLTDDFTKHLADEVASGEHTQAEADAKLAQFTANLDTMINSTGPAGHRGHGGMPHGDGASGSGAVKDQATDTNLSI